MSQTGASPRIVAPSSSSANRNNSAETSNCMVNMVAGCNDAFPEADAWSMNYLQSTQGGLYRLAGSGQPKRHPEVTLEILDRVVGEEGVQPQHQPTLRGILETIRAAMPGLAIIVRFRKLYRFATE